MSDADVEAVARAPISAAARCAGGKVMEYKPKSRAEYIVCIKHTRMDLRTMSWCGRKIGFESKGDVSPYEWYFISADHAAHAGMAGDRLMACPKCLTALIKALRNGWDKES